MRAEDVVLRVEHRRELDGAYLVALQCRCARGAGQGDDLVGALSGSSLKRPEISEPALQFTDESCEQLHLARLIANYGSTRAQLAALVGEEWYR